MAIASGPGASMPTSSVSSRPAPAFSSSRRATASLAPFFARLATASSLALSVNRLRFDARASGTMRPSHSSSLILRRRVPDTPPAAGSTIARARLPPPISAGKPSRPSVRISSVTSVIGIPKRRSGLSLP